jgi:hypothetical protein
MLALLAAVVPSSVLAKRPPLQATPPVPLSPSSGPSASPYCPSPVQRPSLVSEAEVEGEGEEREEREGTEK